MNSMPDSEPPNDSPKRDRTPPTPPARAYAWRERSWRRPRKRNRRSRSRQKRRKPTWRERSMSFSKSPSSAHRDVPLRQVQEVVPKDPEGGESTPFQAPRVPPSIQPVAWDSICAICRCVWLSGADLTELEDRVDALMAVSYPRQSGLAEPWLQRMPWSGAWSSGVHWQ